MSHYAMTSEERANILADARNIVDQAIAKYPKLISRPKQEPRRITRSDIIQALHEMEIGEVSSFDGTDSINVKTAVHLANAEGDETSSWHTHMRGDGTIEVRRLLKPQTTKTP